jgi:hypothetical protein
VRATALYTGFVGDSLAVLDRHDSRTRSALATSALTEWILCFSVGAGCMLVVRHGDLAGGLVYAAILVVWLVEGTFRRLPIARLEF